MSRESIVLAMDAIQDPVSLFEPIYHDGGDTLYVMDQVSDEKNGDRLWLENLSLNEAMEHLSEREKKIVNLRYTPCKQIGTSLALATGANAVYVIFIVTDVHHLGIKHRDHLVQDLKENFIRLGV